MRIFTNNSKIIYNIADYNFVFLPMGLKLHHLPILLTISILSFLSIPQSNALSNTQSGGSFVFVSNYPTNDSLVLLPNAFFPFSRTGSLGINDVFLATKFDSTNIARKVSVEKFEMFIYNRQGLQIFYSNNITIGWNGKYRGKSCPIGAYVYIVRYIVFEDTQDPVQANRYKAVPVEKKGSFLLLE